MKTPDALEDALNEIAQIETSVAEEQMPLGSDGIDEECEDMISDHVNTARNFAKQFFRYGEFITVEFDTEAKTATVLPI